VCNGGLFEYHVEYRKESQMAHVDFLSRNPVALEAKPNSSKVVEVRVDLATITQLASIRAAAR